MVRYL